jgi:hypothetical protein
VTEAAQVEMGVKIEVPGGCDTSQCGDEKLRRILNSFPKNRRIDFNR